MDNTLNLSDMRKFKFLKAQLKSSNLAVKQNTDSEMDELKVLMDLRKTSSLFKMEARKKVERILKRLGAKSVDTWTKED